MKRLNRMRKTPSRVNFITLLSVVIVGMLSRPALTQTPEAMDPVKHDVTQGALRVKIADEVVECPLKHTDVAGWRFLANLPRGVAEYYAWEPPSERASCRHRQSDRGSAQPDLVCRNRWTMKPSTVYL